jgi:FtsP/CotA-like multicopper oxidase with cupredoxin domain
LIRFIFAFLYANKESLMPYRTLFPRHASLLWLTAAALCSGPAFAETTPATLSEALNLRLMRAPPLLHEREALPGHIPSKRDEFEKSYDLFIRYTEGTIYNPGTGRNDKVNLRAYQQKTDTSWDANKAGAARFEAPTVVMAPGQTVRFKLHNQLPEQVEKLPENHDKTEVECKKTALNLPMTPGCFNVTNLHSHGLWVSPSGNSDNVLLSIDLNVSFEYEYNVPVDHPTGTFWYHPHVHGTTAMQVGSGMTGALVVEGDRAPTREENGDLDTLLKKFRPKIGGSSAEVMMLQQVPYACFDNTPGNPNSTYHTTLGVNGKDVGPWTCAPHETGVVENFIQVSPPNAWRTSGRYTMINGQVQPKIPMADKTVYRWRMIDAGFQETVKLRIKEIKDPGNLEKLLRGTLALEAACNGIDVWQFEVASDGLTHSKTIAKTTNYLQPGYRSDILFALPNAGKYCVYDDQASTGLTNEAAKSARLLAVIDAGNGGGKTSGGNADPVKMAQLEQERQTRFMTGQLVAAAQSQPAAVRKTVTDDLIDGLKLRKFVPHKSFSADQIALLDKKPKEYVTFDIQSVQVEGEDKARFLFMVEGNPALHQKPSLEFTYKPDRVDHTLILGTEQIWELNSNAGNHPFHIHVNPFQIISIEPTAPNTVLDEQYKDLIGTWKDTLFVIKGYKIKVATRYERYIGEYVLHCHILEHEDQGMMQNVKVVAPDSQGKASQGAHGGHH